MTHLLRADAQDNRDRALEAARSLFAERGIAAVTMRDIARRADIGPATLYRRFPSKQSLVDHAFAEETAACRRIVLDGAADDDAWRGFCTVIMELCALGVRNQGFTDAFTADRGDPASLAAHRAELLRALGGLARRAQRQGRLRADFTIDDVVLILRAGRGLSTVPLADRAAAAHRFASLAIDALGIGPAATG
ncbi:TetR/AcrR family transcriptional regulator [Gryllotalpicola protaetiae]|uniref:TetR/AcrR family transcriptional regulator n=1 Tax=Gryllotalpicola protaetiae TaxID=2419771 RepID=A0A387BEV8_9MICO|nr:TetR/AcrR family transcriptional regulator [Gryllotalpicola protaetiae]AYG02443.1 TetR/AcrR family transcriptional regulator [Gryllotalpicola protaetiae]